MERRFLIFVIICLTIIAILGLTNRKNNIDINKNTVDDGGFNHGNEFMSMSSGSGTHGQSKFPNYKNYKHNIINKTKE